MGQEDEVENEVEEETEEFTDEVLITEHESEEGEERKGVKCGAQQPGRNVTLQMLLEANILQPGEANMSIEYLGQRFIGDLLNDGKIKSLETDIIFASPSAWACHCKRIINPDKKSGCGWASVKYQGQKLDVFKNKYFKLKASEAEGKDNENYEGCEKEEPELKPIQQPLQPFIQKVRVPIKHAILGLRSSHHDGNTLVESMPFSVLGKIQPFLVSMSTNAALVLDFHCHLTSSEVVGYLAGHWDVNGHNLAITHVFPCRSRLNDRELGPLVEEDIARGIEARRLTLIGWYHSHPTAPAHPSLKDIDSQLEYEIKMKGASDAAYIPCVGLICSPYNKELESLESHLNCYWVMPPPENKPLEYGKPMTMSYNIIKDQFLSQDALNEMKKCADFYKGDADYINFTTTFKNDVMYLDKLKISLKSKFPRDQEENLVWHCLKDLVLSTSSNQSQTAINYPLINQSYSISTPSYPISIPSASKMTSIASTSANTFLSSVTTAIPSSSTSTSIGFNLPPPPPSYFSGADMASVLFASGKFPLPLGLTSQPTPGLLAPPPKLPKTSSAATSPPPAHSLPT